MDDLNYITSSDESVFAEDTDDAIVNAALAPAPTITLFGYVIPWYYAALAAVVLLLLLYYIFKPKK